MTRLCSFFLLLTAAAKAAETTTKPTFRAKNIDYFDAETLAYYLEEPTDSSQPRHDYDVAVMFYASWDQNSHSLAPMYGKIAHLLQAGSKESRLILGLFDCELSAERMKLCTQAGVTHYPTITFISQSGHLFGSKSPKHATKFKGNWQYGDAVLDWLNTMSGLSQWHRAGWGKRIRSFLFRNPRQKKPELPVGLPTANNGLVPSSKVGGSASGVGGTAATSAAVAKAEKDAKDYKDLAMRGAIMMEAILFPMTSESARNNSSLLMSDGGKNYTDMFAELTFHDAWDSKEPKHIVQMSCVLEIALDYCQRVTSEATNDFIKNFERLSQEEQAQADMSALQKQLDGMVNATEPYCAILEDCIISMSTAEQCRPTNCPFKDKAACRYTTSCLADSMMEDYATALGVDIAAGSSKATPPGATTAAEERKAQEQPTNSKKNAWGM